MCLGLWSLESGLATWLGDQVSKYSLYKLEFTVLSSPPALHSYFPWILGCSILTLFHSSVA